MCFAFVLLFSGVSTFGQAPATLTPARILDFGQLYSTFNWDADSKAELQTRLGKTLADQVIPASAETAWPSGIASLDGRTQNRLAMANYTVYYLTALTKSLAVVVVPAAENKHMPANMQAAGDIYFVVTGSAVEFKNAATPVVANVAPAFSATFAAQMNEITTDFANGFVNMTNEVIGEDEDEMIIVYGARIPLEGAAELYFSEDLYAASTSFHAAFSGSTDPAVALKFYRELVRKVESLKLACCGLSKSEEQVDGNRRSQQFNTYDPKGEMSIDYQNMAIEVRMEQGEIFDKDGQLVSNWITVLDIYEK